MMSRCYDDDRDYIDEVFGELINPNVDEKARKRYLWHILAYERTRQALNDEVRNEVTGQ